MKTKTVIEIDYHELDELIEKTYGYPYECVAYEEWNNYEYYSWPFKKELLNEFDQKDLDGFKKTGAIKNWRTHILMQDMINNGILESGEYLIVVFW